MQLQYASKNAYYRIRRALMWTKKQKIGHNIQGWWRNFLKKPSMCLQYMSREREPSIHLVMEALHKDNTVTRVITTYWVVFPWAICIFFVMIMSHFSWNFSLCRPDLCAKSLSIALHDFWNCCVSHSAGKMSLECLRTALSPIHSFTQLFFSFVT